MADQKKAEEVKEPFVAGQDRPEVKLNPDQPLSELRVRDLQAILGSAVFQKPIIKDVTDAKLFKDSKDVWKEHLPDKMYKYEKYEIAKEIKVEHLEVIKMQFEQGPDPRQQLGNPVELHSPLDELIRLVTKLNSTIEQHTDQIKELQARGR